MVEDFVAVKTVTLVQRRKGMESENGKSTRSGAASFVKYLSPTTPFSTLLTGFKQHVLHWP